MARDTRATLPVPRLDGSAGVYLFCGDESFLRRQHLATLTRLALGQGDASMSIAEFDGDQAELATVLDELRTLPFLASRRIVILYDADKFVADHRERLEEYVQSPSPTGVLVLLVDAEKSNTRLFKALASRGGLVLCERLAQSQLAAWIRARAKDSHGKTIDYETSSLLADLVGDDLGRLDSELAKLAAFLGEERKTITAADVDELVANQRLHDAFELAHAIAAKNARAAILRWEDMLRKDSDAPYRVVGMIAWQIRQMLRARLLRQQGVPRDEVLSRLRLPYAVRERFAEQITKFSVKRLQDLLRDLVSVDLASKTGGAPPERGIEQFILTACAAE